MKLHLPKSLRTALFAAFASVISFSSSAYADWASDSRCGGYWLYYDGAQAQVSVDTLTLPPNKPNNSSPSDWATKMYMCAGYSGSEGQQSTFGKIVAGDGVSLTITANPWQNEKFYSELLIKELEFGGGNGSGSFNIVNTFNGYTGTYETQNVTIDRVLGALTSINNAGVLTLNSATISGNVNNSGTLTLGDVEINGNVSNSGTIILQPTLPEGAESLNLNDYQQFNAITNTSTGHIIIENADNKTLSGAWALNKGGKVTLSGGTFGTSSSAITQSITSSNSTVLAFENIEAYIGGGSQYAPWEIGNGAIVHITALDTFSWGHALNLTILTGGVLDLQARQSVKRDSIITLAGGTLRGAGGSADGGHIFGLDFFNGGTITVTADSRIETNIGGHKDKSYDYPTVNFLVKDKIVLTMVGNLTGENQSKFVKQGDGTMLYQGSEFAQALSITSGVFDYNVAKDASVNHSGSISGGGTFRKSGEGTLTLTGAAGTSSNTLGTLEVTEGVLNLGSAYIANGVDIRGGQLNIGADITLGGAINLAGGVLNLGEGKTIILDNLASFFTYKGGSPYNLDKSVNDYGVYATVYTIIDGVTSQNVLGSATFTVGTGEKAQQITLTDGKYYVVEDDTNITDTYIVNIGEVNASSISDAEAFHVYAHDGQDSGCLVLDGSNAGQLLTTTRGNGEIKLATNVSFTDSTTLLFEGTLSIAGGVTLQMGDNEGDTLNFSTLQEIRLDGGNIYYGAKGGKWQHLNVTADSYVHIFDMDTSELKINKVSVAEGSTLTINGSSIAGVGKTETWNHQLNIDVLTGDGSAVFNGPKSGESNISTLYIDSLNGFTGNLAVISYEGNGQKNRYSAVINTGEAGATFNKLEVSGFNTETFTFVVEGDTKVNTISAGCGITIQLKDSATLGAFAKDGTGTITLTGSGVYDLGETYSNSSISKINENKGNFSLGSGWTGTVSITNAYKGENKDGLGLNLDVISQAGSSVELKNVYGWFGSSGGAPMAGNLILTKDTNNPENAAWTVTNGSSQGTDKDTYDTFTMATFNGSVSGDGKLDFAWDGAGYTGFTFNGDIRNWIGSFVRTGTKSFNLTLTGNANTVNAEIKNSTSTGELHLRVQNMNNSAVATFNKDVTVSKLTLSQSATFNANLNVSGNASVANGKTLNMGQQVSDSDAGDGAAAVSEVYLSVSGAGSSAADMTAVSMSKTQIAAVEGKEASISNSLIELKKATSYTIKDIAMSNVTLSAEAKEAYIQMQNVSGNMVLNGGTYEFNAVVKTEQTLATTGNPTLNYQVEGTPQITLGTAGTQVVLTTDPRLDCGQVLGVYDLVFKVNLTLGENYTIDGEFDWSTVVSFGGPLAELLAEQDAVYLTGTEAITALNNPYVTYDYTLVDGLQMLTVTVHGITAPEPTTATLSLIALAALAARRRRK